MLGTLAEAVADKLGMNANLLKAGAYFRDIEAAAPDFFVETSGENVHDRRKPSLSALVIIAHVREGWSLLMNTTCRGLSGRSSRSTTEPPRLRTSFGRRETWTHYSPEQFCYRSKPQSRRPG